MSIKSIIPSILLCVSCNNFLEVAPPSDEISTSLIYTNDDLVNSAISGIYHEMMLTTGFASGAESSIGVLAGLSADEFVSFTEPLNEFERNSIDINSSYNKNYIWEQGYKYVYYSNSALEGISRSSGLSQAVRNQSEGEARFIRAFSYFYLTNFYDDIPLILSTDYRVNRGIKKSPQSIIYEQIIEDLMIAKELLPEDYSAFNDKRIRPIKWTAAALLARVYLYQQNWEKSENEASLVIDSAGLYSLEENTDSTFLARSPEAIWQLMPIIAGNNTNEAITFIPYSTPQYVSITSSLLKSFEENDKRKTSWIDSIVVDEVTYYYPFKYKFTYTSSAKEYSMVFRLAEQYLIRAESKAQQNKISEAQSDVDIVRLRANLPPIESISLNLDKEKLLSLIYHERQIEFFSEWGHRWLDLKRTQLAHRELNTIEYKSWQDTDIFYPIPKTEIENDPNLLPQNQGY